MHLFNSCTLCFSILTSLLSFHSAHAAHIDWSRDLNQGLRPRIARLRSNVNQFIFGRPSAAWSESRNQEVYARNNPGYKDYVVIRLNTTSEEELEALDRWVDNHHLDIWDLQRDHADIKILAKELEPMVGILPKSMRDRGYSFVTQDVAAAVAATFPPAKYARQYQLDPQTITDSDSHHGAREQINNVFFQEYQPLAVINRWMKLLEVMSPELAEVICVGHSAEDRKIYGMRLRGSESGHHHSHRKTVLITAGLHSREWISTSTVTYLIWSLLTEYKSNGIATKFLNHFEVVLVPTMNPDGYEYTWFEDRLWRKNRQPTLETSKCQGIDLDHTFGYQWKQEDRRRDPCTESYGGEEPFQAIETSSLADWVKNETDNNRVKFVSFVDLHSYSQQILFPFSYDCDKKPANLENMEEVAFGLAKAIRLETGELYTIASACGETEINAGAKKWSRVLPYSGSAIDWFHHEVKTRFTYQIKLGDTGSYGFLLPSAEIVPTGNEVYEAFKYFADFLMGHNGIEKPHLADEDAEDLKSLDKENKGTSNLAHSFAESQRAAHERAGAQRGFELRRR